MISESIICPQRAQDINSVKSIFRFIIHIESKAEEPGFVDKAEEPGADEPGYRGSGRNPPGPRNLVRVVGTLSSEPSKGVVLCLTQRDLWHHRGWLTPWLPAYQGAWHSDIEVFRVFLGSVKAWTHAHKIFHLRYCHKEWVTMWLTDRLQELQELLFATEKSLSCLVLS